MRRIKDYVLQEVIGRGAYSTVYRCISLADREGDVQRMYACKVFKRNKMNQRMLKNLHEESIALKKLGLHSNIVNCVATYKTKRHFYLVIEYCNGGDLESLME